MKKMEKINRDEKHGDGSLEKENRPLDSKKKRTVPLFLTLFLMLMFIGLICAYAEVTLTKAPLSWYEGGTGDYALPKLANAEYALSGFMATTGQVETICVNYEASGKVTVEVSADNGLHYYSVVNGVPLTGNFVSGDRIRWRAKTYDEDSKLNALNITYTDSVGTTASFGRPELSGFNYRKEILLKNPSGEELFNYQINIKVGIDKDKGDSHKERDSHLSVKVGEDKKAKGADVYCEENLRQDFYDVRFTAADGETPLGYCLDKGDSHKERDSHLYLEGDSLDKGDSLKSDSHKERDSHFLDSHFSGDDDPIFPEVASFWVRVPQIPKDGVKIYIYYGNRQAGDLSDPKKTFDFYDNFQNPELDTNSWVVKADPKGSAVVKDGQLKLDAAEIISKDFKFKQGIVEYAATIESGFDNSLNLRAKTGDSYDNPGLVVYSSAYKGAEHCIALDDIVKANDAKASLVTVGGKYNYRLTVNGDEIAFERFGVDPAAQAKVTYSGTKMGTGTIFTGYLGLKSGGDGSGRNIIAYSELRARKFTDNQPQVDKTGVTEQVKLPIFSNIALSKKGRLILSDNVKEGVYIGKAIPTEFTARIITPTFKGVNASLAVSANNGVNYKENCVSASYYYASAKDFTAGTKAVGKIKLTPSLDKSAVSEFAELKLDYNPGKILVVKPNGAETFNAGAAEAISWSALDYDSEYPIKLEYSLDSGKNYSIITDKVSNSGAYNWKIPQDLVSPAALIRASDSNEASVSDKSDNVFTIQKSTASSQETEVVGQEPVNSEQAIEEAPTEEAKKEVVQDGAVEEAKDEEAARKQAAIDLNDPNRDYVIDANITISTKADIAFKTLTLGGGTGKNITRLILNNNINPNSGEIIIRNGGQLIQANTNAQAISGDLVIEQGGALTHLENKAEKKYQLNLTAQNIILKSGAMANAYAKGYGGGDARKNALGKAGGKYKGKAAGGGKHTYDTERMPKELGSGGAGSWSVKGGAGGGVIWLAARNEFSISGIINADGEAGVIAADNTYNAAGGSGGSIYLEANKFSGSGAKITAAGGSGNKSGGAGGGGRIHIKAPSGKISGTINANGGSGQDSGAGSVIVE